MSDAELTRHERLQRKYGPRFPDLDLLESEESPQERGKMWREWFDDQIESQGEAMQDKRLHWTRHRLFRWGHQWISSRDGRKWREMEARGNRIRRTFNIVGPGLDFRLGLLEEQRPGWKHDPIPGMGVDGRETADAQHSLVEWHYRTQKAWRLVRLGYANAQTDGVCFLQVYIDQTAGPVIERVRPVSSDEENYHSYKAAGYEVDEGGIIRLPLGPTSEVLGVGEPASTFTGGEIRTRLLLANETYADLEAETIRGPNAPARWFMIRRPRDLYSARLETGDMELKADDSARLADVHADGMDLTQRWQMGLPPYPRKRVRYDQDSVWDFTVYLSPDEDVGDEGLWVRVVGETEMKRGPLPGGVIPVVRITDGSSDPELYPRPCMSDWISDQVSINALGSKILEFARMHAGSRLLALKDTVIEETYSSIVGSIINYRGQKPELQAPGRVSPDLWSMFLNMVNRLEDQTGHNSLSRGKVSDVDSGFQDVSGRAVLGAREMMERQFGPMIRAAADGLTDWAELIVIYAQYLYKTPRLIPMVGRPDLAKRIDSETLKGQPNVYVDPETLMPMPRALRNQMLIDHLDRGLITVAEYQKRAPYAEIRSLNYGDLDQENRAQWINTVVEERWEELSEMEAEELYSAATGLGIFWQDTPEIHMRAIEEIILDERKPWPMRKLMADRWGIYAELARSKNFPIELEMGLTTGQPMPRPPAPLEVLGVPNVVPQNSKLSQQQVVGGGKVPGQSAAPTSAPAGELAGSRSNLLEQ